jgi:hypothetical protein
MKKLIEVDVAEDRIGDINKIIRIFDYLCRELSFQRREDERRIIATCVMQLRKLSGEQK